jgi:uncharacterized Zn-binding protein involved in type VI secretion
MTENSVARVNKDQAGSLIQTGAQTVFTGGDGDGIDWWTARQGSICKGPPNSGDTILKSKTTVYAGPYLIAVEGTVTAMGRAVGKSSPTVFAGNGGPGTVPPVPSV